MNILNLSGQSESAVGKVYEQMFSYMPESVFETFDPEQADATFLFVSDIGRCPIRFSGASMDYSGKNFHLNADFSIVELSDMLSSYFKVLEKPRIAFFDHFNHINDPNLRTLPIIRSDDVLVSTSDYQMSEFVEAKGLKNAFVTQIIDPRRFYRMSSINREPRTLAILKDQFLVLPEMKQVLGNLLSDGTLEKLWIGGGLDEDIRDWIDASKLNVESFYLSWPDAMRKLLNRVSHTLHVSTSVGQELMGFEGAFCGAIPIYPDSEYYRSFFGSDLGVEWILGGGDLEQNLRDILTNDQEFECEPFIDAFSGEQHLPEFWLAVQDLVME